MFSQFFGNYLLNKQKITNEQLISCMEYMRANRVKLGLIAESEGLLTRKQADEKGYLTEADISHLLQLQGNPYLIFVQALEENHVMNREEIQKNLEAFQKEEGLTNSAIDAIKYGDFERLLPTFVTTDNKAVLDMMGLVLRNIVRFVSSYIRIEEAKKVTEYSAKYIACQKTTGAYDGFLAFASDDDAILTIADGYAGEYFEKPDEDALDSVCEFTNCINGLYATELSYKEVVIDMLPPEFHFDDSIEENSEFYVLPLYITGKKVDLLVKM